MFSFELGKRELKKKEEGGAGNEYLISSRDWEVTENQPVTRDVLPRLLALEGPCSLFLALPLSLAFPRWVGSFVLYIYTSKSHLENLCLSFLLPALDGGLEMLHLYL